MTFPAPHDLRPDSDQDVWAQLREGDSDALSALFYRHCDAVYNFAFRRTASWSMAEEVVQATFTTLWRRARAGTVDQLRLASARPLLLVMAGNECGTLLRGVQRQRRLAGRIELVQSDASDHATGAADRVDDERAMSAARRALASIPAKQSEVIELVAWSDCTIAEAAEVLGVPVSTVKSRLFRARTSLAGRLDIDVTEEGSA